MGGRGRSSGGGGSGSVPAAARAAGSPESQTTLKIEKAESSQKVTTKLSDRQLPREEEKLVKQFKSVNEYSKGSAKFIVTSGKEDERNDRYEGTIRISGGNLPGNMEINTTFKRKMVGTYEDSNRGTTRPIYAPDYDSNRVYSALKKSGIKEV